MLHASFVLLQKTLATAMDVSFQQDTYAPWSLRLEPFELSDATDAEEWKSLDDTARLIALLSLASVLAPWALQELRERQLARPWLFAGGGRWNNDTQTLQPTVRTALLLLAGIQTEKRNLLCSNYFLANSPLFTKNILKPLSDDPFFGDPLLECTPEFIYKVAASKDYVYHFSPQFPAELVDSKHEWDDLVVNYSTRKQLEDLKLALRHHNALLQQSDIGRSFRENHIALFYGDPGTGKTMAAGLLGKTLGVPVYKIDLSRVVSKWVGETSKNLRYLFDTAEQKNWILFFDEADALFGSRSNQGGSNEQYHNQDIAYLLQRIDTFRGFAILSTNLRSNMDKAFARRIDDKIYFPSPDAELRQELWSKVLQRSGLRWTERAYLGKEALQTVLVPGDWEAPDHGIHLRELAECWELSGAHLVKIMKFVMMLCMEKNTTHVSSAILMQGIVRELQAQGKSWKV
ncbi:MAG: ATP-binding protein [Cytophagaceae bacterium]|jgi:hypothetical protein|nr:ATP-binding protein [Cytophagaceae bacterium]